MWKYFYTLSHKCGKIYIHIHSTIWWRKTGMLKYFAILLVHDIGEDYTSQTRSSE